MSSHLNRQDSQDAYVETAALGCPAERSEAALPRRPANRDCRHSASTLPKSWMLLPSPSSVLSWGRILPYFCQTDSRQDKPGEL